MKGVALEAAEAKANQYQAMISKQEQFNSEHARLIQSIRDDCTKQIEVYYKIDIKYISIKKLFSPTH